MSNVVSRAGDSARPIVVALSGGVDSAAAAAMLVDAGKNVVGMTMRLFDASGTVVSSGGRCCGPRDIEDARRVCDHLDIPFYVVDFSADFQRDVVDDFVDAYLAGETPNPCVKCNQHIKFTPLLRRARALGAEVVATGHYARIDRDDSGRLRLRRGVDANKDQSYFLFSMPVSELGSVAFPLGHLTKHEVRDLAARYGLPNAAKAESQEICFVPDGNYAGFVSARALARGVTVPPRGDIVDESGAVLGRHSGIHGYTVGQRRGLGNLKSSAHLTPGEPVYVLRLDVAANRVVVGTASAATRARLHIRDLRWFIEPPAAELPCRVQIRHRQTPLPATVSLAATGTAEVRFASDPPIAAPGQSAVFYDAATGDTVLGGGWITPSLDK